MTRGGALWEGRRRAEEIQLRIRYTPEPPSQDDDMPFLIWPLIVRIYIYEGVDCLTPVAAVVEGRLGWVMGRGRFG